MVLEYMDHDLTGVLGHPEFKFEPAHAKSLVKQMLEGVAFLHHMGVLHRDIKGNLSCLTCHVVHLFYMAPILTIIFAGNRLKSAVK